MSNRQEQLDAVEITIETAKKVMGRKHAMDRLMKNKDWQKLIEEDYFEKEAARLVLLKADPNMQSADQQADILRAIDAIGNFREYLRTVQQLGAIAERSIDADEQTREELLAEELAEEEDPEVDDE